jgi:putative component of membrane protein insertase Oxa1/YidC/SpoIIIJ protein YidD
MEASKKIIKYLINLPAKIFVALINVYQLVISPDHSWLKAKYPYGYCRHFPSCSEYAKQVIVKDGFIRGIFKAFIRISKCNPWSKPSFTSISNI